MKRLRLSAAFVAIALLSPAIAAAGPAEDSIVAESLFQDAKKLIEQGRFGEACPKLAESARLAPGVGVLLNLGGCYERTGKVASAWAALSEAADRAKAANDTSREKLARDRANALSARLPKLVIDAPAMDGLTIERDGQSIPKAALGQAIPIDPGDHTIVARAPGHEDSTRHVTAEEGKTAHIAIGALTVKSIKSAKRTKNTKSGIGGRGIGAIIAGGLGLVGLGVGIGTGLAASSKMSSARALCKDSTAGTGCPQDALTLQSDASPLATISTVGFITAGVGGAAALGLALSGSSSDGDLDTGVSLRVAPGSLSLGGSF